MKRKLNMNRLAITLFLIVAIPFSIDALVRTSGVRKTDPGYTELGNFKEKTDCEVEPVLETASTGEIGEISLVGFMPMGFYDDQLHRGPLCISVPNGINSPNIGLVSLSGVKNDCYYLGDAGLKLDGEAAAQLTKMLTSYAENTGNKNIIVYNTTGEKLYKNPLYATASNDAAFGYSFDLALIGGNGKTVAYDGRDTEAWIVENCCQYGFVQEDFANAPYHFRYVGRAHAEAMTSQNLTLTQYVDFLRSYSPAAPYKTDVDGVSYESYFTKYAPDARKNSATEIQVPECGNYTVSGNNIDGFIITYMKAGS